MTIGETLRKAREAHGLSIADVKNATLMMTRQIEELENDDFSSFAAPVYGKGFIRLYARAVGLDPDPLVAEYLARASGRPDPSRDQPLVPLETIAEEGGAIEVVRPEPHGTPKPAPAPEPEPKPTDAPKPGPDAADAAVPADDLFAAAAAASAAPKPAPAPEPKKSAPFEKRAAPLPPPDRAPSGPRETFEKRAAPLPEAAAAPAPTADEPAPEKRIAPVEPGMPPPEPPASDRGERRNEVRIEFSDRPVVKRLAEEEADDAPRSSLSDHPVAPPAVPLSVPPFVFPEPPVAPEPEPDAEPLLRAEPAPAKPAAKPRDDEESVVKEDGPEAAERPAGPFRMRLRGLGSALRARLSALRARTSGKADGEKASDASAKEASAQPRRSRPILMDADPDEAPVPSRGARWRRPALIGGAAAAVVLVLALLFSRCSGSPKPPKPAGAAQTNAPAATAPAAPQQAATAAPQDAGTPGEDWSTPRRILDPPRSFAR